MALCKLGKGFEAKAPIGVTLLHGPESIVRIVLQDIFSRLLLVLPETKKSLRRILHFGSAPQLSYCLNRVLTELFPLCSEVSKLLDEPFSRIGKWPVATVNFELVYDPAAVIRVLHMQKAFNSKKIQESLNSTNRIVIH